MKTLMTIAAVLLMGGLTQGQTSTTVHHGDGTQTTVTCSGTAANTNCDVYDSTPSLLSIMKENKARNKFCSARKIKRGTPECEAAWSVADENPINGKSEKH